MRDIDPLEDLNKFKYEKNSLIITSLLIKCVKSKNIKDFEYLLKNIDLNCDIIKIIKQVINIEDFSYINLMLKNNVVISKIKRSQINLLSLIINDKNDNIITNLINSDFSFSEYEIIEGFIQSISNKNLILFNYFLNKYEFLFFNESKKIYSLLSLADLKFIKSYIEHKSFKYNSQIETITMSAYRNNNEELFRYLLDRNIISFKVIKLIFNARHIDMNYVNIIINHKNGIRLIPDNFKLKYKNDKLQEEINLLKIKFKIISF
jgi:hypothetical protein